MSRYALARRARSQLEGIHRYSTRRWGGARADQYVQTMFAALEQIGQRKMPARPVPAIFQVQGWYCPCQRHFIY